MTRTGLTAAWLLVLCAACRDEPRRVPYIPPDLANWPRPYRGVAGVRIQVLNTGFVKLREAQLLSGGGITRSIAIPVPVLVVEHPRQGVILVDSGVSASATTAGWPAGLMDLLEPIEVVPARPLAEQLGARGIQPDAVRWVVLTNLRSHHTGNVEAFRQARVVATKEQVERARSGATGFHRADIDDLANWKFVEPAAGKPLGTFKAAIDLLEDGSIFLIAADGVSPGNLVVLIRSPQRAVIWAGDLLPRQSVLRTATQPATVEDGDVWWTDFWHLKRFNDLAPEVVVLAGNDAGPLTAVPGVDVAAKAFTPPAAAVQTPSPAEPWRRLLP